MVKVAAQHDMIVLMQAATHGIAALAGALKMLHRFLFVPQMCGRWTLGRKAARLHIKVFACHYAWQWIPSVVRCLPDILLPVEKDSNSFCGAPA